MLWFLRTSLKALAAAPLLLVVGCDRFPLAIQNQTKAPIIVEYATQAGKCDLNKSEILKLAPGERFAVRCAPTDLVSVRFSGPDGRKCVLSKADVAGPVREEKGFRGSFLLPLRSC